MTVENIQTLMLQEADMRRHYDDLVMEYSNTLLDPTQYVNHQSLYTSATSTELKYIGDTFSMPFNYSDSRSSYKNVDTYRVPCELHEREIPWSWHWKDYYRSGITPEAALIRSIGKSLSRNILQFLIDALVREYKAGRLAVLPADAIKSGTKTDLTHGKIELGKVYLDHADMPDDNRICLTTSLSGQQLMSNDDTFRNRDYLGSTGRLISGNLPEKYSGFQFITVPQLKKYKGKLVDNFGIPVDGTTSLTFVFSKYAVGIATRLIEPLLITNSELDYKTFYRKTYAVGSEVIRTDGVLVIENEQKVGLIPDVVRHDA